MDLLRKTVPFELGDIKARENGGWTVSGYASTFGGEPDSYGDVVAKGAFLDSLAKRLPKLYYQHYEPIGSTVSIDEDDKGLFGTWSIVDTNAGTDAHKLAKAGVIDKLSIGYRTVEAEYREDGVRVLKKVDLFEVSLVPIPANENAVITTVKADLPFDQLLTRSTAHLTLAVEEAKALHGRRAQEGRELPARHLEALDALIAEAKAAMDALTGLRTEQQAKAARSLSTRLEFARRRLASRGLLEMPA